MKAHLLYLLLFFALGNSSSYCQYTVIKTPYGEAKLPMSTTMPRFNNYNSSLKKKKPEYLTTEKHKYTIVLLHNDSLQARAKLEITGLTHEITYKHPNGEISIYQPKDTRELFYVNKGTKVSGIPWKDYWLFKTVTGKITVFSSVPDTEMEYSTALQKGDAPIIEFTLENVLDLVEDNEKAKALALKGQLLKAVKQYNKE